MVLGGLRLWILSSVALLASCGGGGGVGGTPTPAPSGLSYPRPPVFIAGQSIAPLSPTVTGTVSSYTVGPALPAGLSLNASTGVISGTPTGAAALASYTVTATNMSGSTTAAVSITVNDVAPAIHYASAGVTLTTGVPAQGLTPSNSGGAATSWEITPALPQGLTFSTSNGSISGTPTDVAAATTFTVTAGNSGGQSTATLTLTIQSGLLVDLGHSQPIRAMRLTATRVLSIDESSSTGTWVLWNYATAARLTRGSWACKSTACTARSILPADLAGPTLVEETAAGLEVRSASDGSLLTVISAPLAWWKLATDGSYLCGGSASGLTVWSPAGTVIASRTGDYSNAVVFAASGQVQIALGAAGAGVIETVALPSGAATNSAPFQGQFNSWFLDGQRFLTNTSNTVRTYSSAGAQQDIAALSTVNNLAGQGDWFWIVDSGHLYVYKVGASSTPAASYAIGSLARAVPSGPMIGVLGEGTAVSLVDLTGSSPVKTDVAGPMSFLPTFAAASPTQWLLGYGYGVVVDGASLAGSPRYFGYGAAWSIAGSSQNVAVATASGSILMFEATTKRQLGTIPAYSSQVALSADGTVLVAAGDGNEQQYHPDQTINVYAPPAATPIYTWPYAWLTSSTQPFTIPMEVSLSASGTVLGQELQSDNTPVPGGVRCSRQATGPQGGPVLWSDTFTAIPCAGLPVRLSPDGSHVAVANGRSFTSATNLYSNGTLVNAVPGWAVGWLDDNRILVNIYVSDKFGVPAFSAAPIYDASGTKITDTRLPELGSFQVVDADSLYDPVSNTIYSVSSGAAVWSSASASLHVGAVAGPNVVFASGSLVLAQPH